MKNLTFKGAIINFIKYQRETLFFNLLDPDKKCGSKSGDS